MSVQVHHCSLIPTLALHAKRTFLKLHQRRGFGFTVAQLAALQVNHIGAVKALAGLQLSFAGACVAQLLQAALSHITLLLSQSLCECKISTVDSICQTHSSLAMSGASYGASRQQA